MSAGFGSDLGSGVAVDVSVEELVGEMVEIPCESRSHGEGRPYHDEGPARWYVLLMHDCTWRAKGEIYAACETLALHIGMGGDRPDARGRRCMSCGTVTETTDELVKVVGRIGGGDG